jgi:hypothetical protein
MDRTESCFSFLLWELDRKWFRIVSIGEPTDWRRWTIEFCCRKLSRLWPLLQIFAGEVEWMNGLCGNTICLKMMWSASSRSVNHGDPWVTTPSHRQVVILHKHSCFLLVNFT